MLTQDQENRICPGCGQALGAKPAEGLCPACLFKTLVEVPDDNPPGDSHQRIGDYLLLEQIASGGMGTIYKARHERLNRTVALKVISISSHAPDVMERFRTEVEASARLDHPHIVPIYEVGQHKGQLYYSMKLVEGNDLSRILRGGQAHCLRCLLPPKNLRDQRVAVQMMIKVARAVQRAHQLGILHRDIKPANILLDGKGEPYLTDFGLAKLLEKDSAITRTMAVMGTPAYMAPEQAAGKVKEITTATDVYGIGATLYEVLTGEPPFAGGTTMETVRQVLEKEVKRLRLINPSVDRDLETICLKSLEKDPIRRYGSAEALAEDLERWLRLEPIRARPVSLLERGWKWVHRRPATAAIVGTVLLSLLVTTLVASVMSVRLATARNLAEQKAAESRAAVVRLNVSTGERLVRQGDYFGGLAWYLEALRLGTPEENALQRYRIGSLLRQAPVLQELWFHPGAVLSASFNREGTIVLTASSDGCVRTFDVTRGVPLLVLQHSNSVPMAAFSPNNLRIASICADKSLSLWDSNTGELVARRPPVTLRRISFSLDGKLLAYGQTNLFQLLDSVTAEVHQETRRISGPISDAAFSRDNRFVAIACAGERAVHILETANLATTRAKIQTPAPPTYLEFSPDGERILITWGVFARVWEVPSPQPLTPPLEHRSSVKQAFFTPDGEHIVTTSFNQARLWTIEEALPSDAPIQHDSVIFRAVLSPDGHRLMTGSFDHTARFWDTRTHEPVLTSLRHGAAVQSVSISPNGKYALTAGSDGTARLWRLPAGGSQVLPHQDEVFVSRFDPSSGRVLTASRDGTAQVWNAQSGEPCLLQMATPVPLRAAEFSHDGSKVLLAGDKGLLVVYDASSGRELLRLLHPKRVTNAHFSPDDSEILTACDDQQWRLWNVKAPNAPRLSGNIGQFFGEVDWSRDGKLLATGSASEAQVWDSATGARIGPSLHHPGSLTSVRFDATGDRLLTACSDATTERRAARLWNFRTGEPVTAPMEHFDGVLTAEFSPDGRLVATGSEDNTARLWSARTGEPLTPPMQHRHYVNHVAFSRDGKRLVTTSYDGTARVWDAATGAAMAPPFHHDLGVLWAEFNLDGTRLITASSDRTARLWDVSKTELPFHHLDLLSRVLSNHRLDPRLELMPLETSALSNAWHALRTASH